MLRFMVLLSKQSPLEPVTQWSIIFKTRFQALQTKCQTNNTQVWPLQDRRQQVWSARLPAAPLCHWEFLPAPGKVFYCWHSAWLIICSSMLYQTSLWVSQNSSWGCVPMECWDVWAQHHVPWVDLLKSHQFSPFVPFLRGRIKGREGLWAEIIPWLPASAFHGRIPSLTWRLPPIPYVPLISSSRGEHGGSRLD